MQKGKRERAARKQELKDLSRAELLELLAAEAEENERLRAELEEARAQLKERRILIAESGSIAEAALALNGVFQAAQDAADQYLANVRFLARDKAERRE